MEILEEKFRYWESNGDIRREMEISEDNVGKNIIFERDVDIWKEMIFIIVK